MTKRTQPTPDDYDLDAKAAAALDEARELPPGPERTEALKRAGLLRNAADGTFTGSSDSTGFFGVVQQYS